MTPQFGIALPAFASPGAGLFRTPGFAMPDGRFCLDLALTAEALDFDMVVAPDHLMIGKDDAVPEGWTLLSAVAALTSRVRLALIQQSNLFRHPGVFAKSAATLDALSDGRFTYYCNFGSKQAETSAFGLPFPEAEATRVAMMREGLAVLTALWSGESVDFDGQFYKLSGAVARPVPRQLPPIWFAGTQPDHLDLMARLANGWCTPPVSLDELDRQLDAVGKALQSTGRDFSNFELGIETQILIAPTLDELRDTLKRLIALDPDGLQSRRAPLDPVSVQDFIASRTDKIPDVLTDTWLVGTPDMVERKLSEYMERGVSRFILWFMDLPEQHGLNLFAKTILAAHKSQKY